MDKRALARGFEPINAEIARVKPLIDEGGYVATVDHSAPPDIPCRNSVRFMQQLRQACG